MVLKLPKLLTFVWLGQVPLTNNVFCTTCPMGFCVLVPQYTAFPRNSASKTPDFGMGKGKGVLLTYPPTNGRKPHPTHINPLHAVLHPMRSFALNVRGAAPVFSTPRIGLLRQRGSCTPQLTKRGMLGSPGKRET